MSGFKLNKRAMPTLVEAESNSPTVKPKHHAGLTNGEITPSIVKRRQILEHNKWFLSPTDNIRSPCSRALVKRAPLLLFNRKNTNSQ